MTDNKLTDAEIKKALECCSVQGHFVCDECPAWVDSHCIGTHKQTLDLINRLQARVEKCEKVEHFADKTIATLQAEIERLLQKTQRPQDADPMDFCGVLCDFSEELITKAKAEARKEFAERVSREIIEAIISNDKAITERESKHKVNRYEDNFCAMCDGKVIALSGIKSFVDNLLIEMESEKNVD